MLNLFSEIKNGKFKNRTVKRGIKEVVLNSIPSDIIITKEKGKKVPTVVDTLDSELSNLLIDTIVLHALRNGQDF